LHLRDDLGAVLLPAGRDPLPELVRLVDILVTVERPESIYSWARRPRVQPLLRGLGDLSIHLDHDALDAAPSSPAREHIRQLLIHHGLLPWRDPDLARFETWLRQRLELIEDPAVRRPVEQFATWHHLRRIRAKVHRSQDVRGAAQGSKQQITEVTRFLTWLATRHTAIGTCQQGDLDQWLVEGPSSRHQIETFIAWATAKKLSAPLTTGAWPARSSRLITQEVQVAATAAGFTQLVRGRWLRGVPGIRRQLPLQLSDPPILHRDMPPQRNHQLGEFLIGRLRHKPIVPQTNKKTSRHAARQPDQLHLWEAEGETPSDRTTGLDRYLPTGRYQPRRRCCAVRRFPRCKCSPCRHC